MSEVDPALIEQEIRSTFPQHTIQLSVNALPWCWDVRLVDEAGMDIVFVVVGRRGTSGTELGEDELRYVTKTLQIYHPRCVHWLHVYWNEAGVQEHSWNPVDESGSWIFR